MSDARDVDVFDNNRYWCWVRDVAVSFETWGLISRHQRQVQFGNVAIAFEASALVSRSCNFGAVAVGMELCACVVGFAWQATLSV
jgi:hypothetical protein